MELDARKQKVLKAIIDDYIESAEPVGSRTLARKHDLGVSPATIRNEMADVEMLGYLEHLHTSSGRIPSSKGYRFYVNGLIPPKPVSEEEKKLINDSFQHLLLACIQFHWHMPSPPPGTVSTLIK